MVGSCLLRRIVSGLLRHRILGCVVRLTVLGNAGLFLRDTGISLGSTGLSLGITGWCLENPWEYGLTMGVLDSFNGIWWIHS